MPLEDIALYVKVNHIGRSKMRGKKAKNAIRELLQNIETTTLSALQLGGHGEWMTTQDMMTLVEENNTYKSRYQLTPHRISKLVMEFRFPRRKFSKQPVEVMI
jgi:hypothetical protein